ncbi:Inactive serine protease PAMR1 [Lonchura striata]|uniref:Inactive serine protease PAMR1 n=1 Tax=Lonchura striata TaxID=40157 RepID=A0A218UY28_9PASE|nr:Inactive serine protease PAMR1 [Lonchura striata domestica]
MLSLEFDYMCQYDYVEIRDGDNLDSQIIKKFCGNERPPPIRSTGSSLHVLFQSDGSKNFDGFHAVFEEITVLEEKNCSDPGGPLNGYRRVVEDTGLLNGRYAKIGTVIAFFCNNSYVLSGNEQRTCQDDGEWSGKQPICIKDENNLSLKRIVICESIFMDFYCDIDIMVNIYINHKELDILKLHREQVLRHIDKIRPARFLSATLGSRKETLAELFELEYFILILNPLQLVRGKVGNVYEPHHLSCECEKVLCNIIFFLACREPKISDLVRQKVLPMQVQSRETPLHQLYSSAFSKQKLQIYPTKKPALPFGELPPGYQHLHTQLQYECVSPFYRRLGSSRRTCLKTGKWSGRAPVCIPICGKAENITLKKAMSSMRWPWQAAIYRTASGVKENSLRKGSWILICSGALVNERTVVVAAHCVTDLGKTIVLKTAELKVVLGKFYRDDDRDEKTIQNLRISAIIVHPNYDPILLDSDIAVIKLLDKARISSRVQPICLSSSHDLTSSTEDLKIMVTGWKVLADIKDLGYKNDTIRMGVVQMVDSLLCEQQYEDNGIQVSITDNMFCAKQDRTTFSNICPAETGGIAAITLPGKASPELRWHLMGLVSWGYDKTCSLELYSGYTKALPFKDWIEKNMK